MGDAFPAELVDKKVKEELSVLRKCRFFAEFNATKSSLHLAQRLTEKDLKGATPSVKAPALAWCGRLLTQEKDSQPAIEAIDLAEDLGDYEEVHIAKAFLRSKSNDLSGALQSLASIDTPQARSAAFVIKKNHEGEEVALDWLSASNIEISDLDAEGEYFVLSATLELARWEHAAAIIKDFHEEKVDTLPSLRYMVAMTNLLTCVPLEWRSVVLNQIPFQAAGFPLASTEPDLEVRRRAQADFSKAASATKDLGLQSAASSFEEYALWMALLDPEQHSSARQTLELKLRDTRSALNLVPLAIQFGLTLDLSAVEQAIREDTARNGGITLHGSLARLSLALKEDAPSKAAEYIEHHYEDLARYLDPIALRSLQIEMYCDANIPERAEHCLDQIRPKLTPDGIDRIQTLIESSKEDNPTSNKLRQFEHTDSLIDLKALVAEMESRGLWEDIVPYAKDLYERTHAIQDALLYITALVNSNKNEEVCDFIKSHREFTKQSQSIQILYAWALYRLGDFVAADSEISEIDDCLDHLNCRALKKSIAITSGDWNLLELIVSHEAAQMDQMNARELLSSAHLATHINSSYAKQLTWAAAEKGRDDAEILANTYFLASSAGWEDDPAVGQWLMRAAELSGEEGPVKTLKLNQILDWKPAWDRQESETWSLFHRAELPIFLAAQALRRSLAEFTIKQAHYNLQTSDPRRRGAIPGFSGARSAQTFDLTATVGSFDVTALLTLAYLDLLDSALDSIHEVLLPHSTMVWLFEEKQKVAFHQPSRIKNAHSFRDILSKGAANELVPSSVPDSVLADYIGEDLAQLIAEAKATNDIPEKQGVVVRPFPVHRLSTLMAEEADLSDYYDLLVSCTSVVDKLREKGIIGREEQRKAVAYLKLHEKAWPSAVDITDGSTLYFDDLSVTYFHHLGLLGKVQEAGYTLIIGSKVIRENDALIQYENTAAAVNNLIEELRAHLSKRIETGAIRLGATRPFDEDEDTSSYEHPSVGAIALADQSTALISDDRFVNRRNEVRNDETSAPVYSTLDIIDSLFEEGILKLAERLEARTKLRTSGYLFIPLDSEEISTYLAEAKVIQGKIQETLELRAMRESLLLAQMSGWLLLPEEGVWLESSLRALIEALKTQWQNHNSLDEAKARSEWLVDQIDLRAWAEFFGHNAGERIIRQGRGAHILYLLDPPSDVSDDIRDAYWEWIEARVLLPIKESFPEVFAWLIEWYRDLVFDACDAQSKENQRDA